MLCPICSKRVDRSGEYVETTADATNGTTVDWHFKCWLEAGGK
jgi:hypothetical protein